MGRYRDPQTLCEAIFQKNEVAVDAYLSFALPSEINQYNVYRPRDMERAYPIELAVRRKDLDTVKKLLEKGANANQHCYMGRASVVAEAVRKDQLEMVQLLHQYGADLHVENKVLDNTNLLSEAVVWGSLEMVTWLVEQGVEINLKSWRSPLDKACEYSGRDYEKVVYLLEKGAKIQWIRDDDITYQPAVSYCISHHKNAKVLNLLLDNMGESNQFFYSSSSNRFGVTHVPLIVALLLRPDQEGKKELLQSLIGHGVKLNHRVDFNLNTVGWAVGMNGEPYDTQSTTIERIKDMSLLSLAVISAPDCIDDLLEQGLDLFEKDKNGNNLLHVLLSHSGHHQIEKELPTIMRLLEEGVSPMDKNKKGLTPFHLFVQLLESGLNFSMGAQQALIACVENGAQASEAYFDKKAKATTKPEIRAFIEQLELKETLKKTTPLVSSRNSMRRL